MSNPNLVTVAEEIADVQLVRPHLVILGAGASRAAFPAGEVQGRRLPVMADFAEIVPVAPVFDKSGIDWHGKNFEEIYSLLSEKPEYEPLQKQLDAAVFTYFSELRLPDTPTLYDLLVLCLRQKDVIATFNWDPFLIQALQRNGRTTKSLPTPLFLHGNVACQRCGKPLERDKLLFPVAKKDYSADPSIKKAWDVVRVALEKSLTLTIFGYSAPASDQDAKEIMLEAWGEKEKRQFEAFEIIDIRSKDELYASWEPFIFGGHYKVYPNITQSLLFNHPRRSIETFLKRYIDGKFIEGNPVPQFATLKELQDWFGPLIEAEQRLA
jgi:hypothetical protein